MKHLYGRLLLLIAAMITASCVAGQIDREESGLVERTYTVLLDPDTKATLGDGLYPSWEKGETVSVYDPVAHVARNFAVTSVNGTKAEIKGAISAGDFPISAVYPASAAGKWNSISDCTLNIPLQQNIPEGRNVDPSVLVSQAYSETTSSAIVFRNAVSLLKFKPGRESVEEMSFILHQEDSSTEYVAKPASAFDTEMWYYMAVVPGEYDSGVTVKSYTLTGDCFTRSSESPVDAKAGGILSMGVMDGGEKSVAYKILSEGSFANMSTYLESVPVFKNLTNETKLLLNIAAAVYLPWRNDPVKTIVFTHKSTGPSGDPVTLSAVMYVPETALNRSKTLNGVVIANHASITADSERPSLVHDAQSVAAWKGYAIVLSDYCGFGADASHSQAYLNPDVAAKGSFDAYFAAMQILKDLGVIPGSNLYNMGYSQGAFNGMANIRYLSQHPELGLKFKKSFLGGGPYDIRKTWMEYLTGSYPAALPFAPVTLCSYVGCGDLNLTYERLFKGQLLANYQKWILSKNYSISQISTFLKNLSLADMLTDDVLNQGTEVNDMIMATCDRFSLISGWKPAPGNVIRLYHSTQDDIVPYANLSSIRKFLEENASDCTVTYKDGANGSHTNAVVTWALDVITNW